MVQIRRARRRTRGARRRRGGPRGGSGPARGPGGFGPPMRPARGRNPDCVRADQSDYRQAVSPSRRLSRRPGGRPAAAIRRQVTPSNPPPPSFLRATSSAPACRPRLPAVTVPSLRSFPCPLGPAPSDPFRRPPPAPVRVLHSLFQAASPDRLPQTWDRS